jgi:nucleoside phosphorylase
MTQLFIFTALECEAKPIINYFGLKKELNEWSFSIYKNDTIVLAISGIGKIPMAAAVAYVFALYSRVSSPVIINIGIAGHKTLELGSLILASKISDNDSGTNFYPQFIGNNFPKCKELVTSSKPCKEYKTHCLFDMEASAFYEIALKFSSNELVHCIKIISDNETSSINEIKPKLVVEWITGLMDEIDELLQFWLTQSDLIKPNELEEYEEIINKWHFSVTSQIKLKALLQRWNVISADSWVIPSVPPLRNSKEILKKLEADINCLEHYL